MRRRALHRIVKDVFRGATEVATHQEEVWKPAPGQLQRAYASEKWNVKEQERRTIFVGRVSWQVHAGLPMLPSRCVGGSCKNLHLTFRSIDYGPRPCPVIYFVSCSRYAPKAFFQTLVLSSDERSQSSVE